MAGMIKMSVLGDRRTIRRLNALPEKARKRVIRPALRAGGKIIRNSARQKAPRDTGELFRSIKMRDVRVGRKNIEVFIGSSAPHAHFQEFGWVMGDERQPGQPFLRPALRDSERAFRRKVRQQVKARLRKVVRRR